MASREQLASATQALFVGATMTVLNKAVVREYQGPLEPLLLLQSVFALLLLFMFTTGKQRPSFRMIMRWFPLSLLFWYAAGLAVACGELLHSLALVFSGNLYTSILSLKFVSIPTFSVFKNSTSLATALLQVVAFTFFARRAGFEPSVNRRGLQSLIVIMLGIIGYASSDLEYSAVG